MAHIKIEFDTDTIFRIQAILLEPRKLIDFLAEHAIRNFKFECTEDEDP